MNALLIIMLSYLIGSISSAYILGRIVKDTDIRKYGSGNAGTTNALRVFGKKIGGLAFAFDVLKGILTIYIGGLLLGYTGKLIAGFFVVIGHNWPIFLKFKGGKGIATSFGVLLSLHLPTALITVVIFIITLILGRYVSLSSILGAISAPIIVAIMTKPFNREFFILTLILAILALYRHRANIKRLLEGNEYKIGQKVNRG